MHVFIDTNILLNFFHFSKDELDALHDVFGSHEHGSATVHLTQQVRDEFARNRENRIKDALKKFKETRFSPSLPSFMKAYGEYGQIRSLSHQLQSMQQTILEKVQRDIESLGLLADQLIGQIFQQSNIHGIDRKIFEEASMRMTLGNPPGKSGSIGDAVNWEILLKAVPDGEDLHVISEDGDFYSAMDEHRASRFLVEEWKSRKHGTLSVYRTLSAFMSQHFDGVAFSFDKNKEALIDELFESGSFARTHELVGKLQNYSYFSAKEVARILDAAVANDQVGWIATDTDVSDFLNRVAVPHIATIVGDEQKAVLKKVSDEQGLRKTMGSF